MDTRQQILEKNFEAMRLHGYQGVRADKVVKELGITKGALYHYFPNKLELGYAIVDEIIGPRYIRLWKTVAAEDGNPIHNLIKRLDFLADNTCSTDIQMGCILNNLMQEMSPLDEGFRQRLNAILQAMQQAVQGAFEKAKKQGILRENVNEQAAAIFFIASFEGCFGIAKTVQSKELLKNCFDELKNYLQSLIV